MSANIGDRFGRLAVIEILGVMNGARRCICLCDCGNRKEVRLGNVMTGRTRSCGCLEREARIKHGKAESPEYRIWCAMKTRCFNSNVEKYPIYGGRGITVCERWRDSFAAFLEDMGPRPSDKHSIDRVDNNGNYEPGNCRWATMKEQNNNRRKIRPWKLTPSVAESVLSLAETGLSQTKIARAVGVSQPSVAKLIRRARAR